MNRASVSSLLTHHHGSLLAPSRVRGLNLWKRISKTLSFPPLVDKTLKTKQQENLQKGIEFNSRKRNTGSSKIIRSLIKEADDFIQKQPNLDHCNEAVLPPTSSGRKRCKPNHLKH